MNPNATACKHEDFMANVNVGRFSEKDGGPIDSYCADITVKCAQCEMPFRFLGVPHDYSFNKPTVDILALELRAPIYPNDGTEPLPTPKPGFSVTRIV